MWDQKDQDIIKNVNVIGQKVQDKDNACFIGIKHVNIQVFADSESVINKVEYNQHLDLHFDWDHIKKLILQRQTDVLK